MPAGLPTPPTPLTAAIIPAWNEASTVGAVVYAALDARLVDEVIVVDNASTDGTGAVALAHGARVVHEPIAGKGQAMQTGVATTDAVVIVFLDADLVGLQSDQVDEMVRAVLDGEADMACGLFDRGPVANPIFLEGLPVLTGPSGVSCSTSWPTTTSAATGSRPRSTAWWPGTTSSGSTGCCRVCGTAPRRRSWPIPWSGSSPRWPCCPAPAGATYASPSPASPPRKR